ncbi:MAG: TIGR03943 family protein [Eubacteriales bacterium]|nr:TIGR03943 family protein [Eubacteriales bacterium]
MKNGTVNYRTLFFAILYLAFGAAGIYLLISGAYLRFVTPKSAKYLVFMTVIFFIFSIVEFRRIFRQGQFEPVSGVLVFMIPLALIATPNLSVDGNHLATGFVANPGASENGVAGTEKKRGYDGNVYRGESMTFTIEEKKPPTLEEANQSNSFYRPVELSGLDEATKTITVDNAQFYDWVTEIFAHTDQYMGYTIKITGKLFHNDDFMGPNQVVPSRLMMTCCVADAVPCGLIADVADISNIKLGTWALVTGTLKRGQYNGQTGPVIQVTKIESASAPENEYVYPK